MNTRRKKPSPGITAARISKHSQLLLSNHPPARLLSSLHSKTKRVPPAVVTEVDQVLGSSINIKTNQMTRNQKSPLLCDGKVTKHQAYVQHHSKSNNSNSADSASRIMIPTPPCVIIRSSTQQHSTSVPN